MEGTEAISLGKSLLVPCVQELAKEAPTTVPPRYVRPDQDPPFFSTSDSQPQIPVIDMQNLLSDDHQTLMNSELQKMDLACKQWGFFQLINHGVDWRLVERMKMEIEGFFNLPMEEKKKYWQREGEMEGFGQAFVVSEEQKLGWGDMFYMITLPPHLRKPHLFPQLPLPIRETLESYIAEMKKLALKILDLMATALRMDPCDMRELFEEGYQMVRMNYYPPCPQPELVMGLNKHSDAVGLTILLQVGDVEGLQIRKDGKWVPVKPLPQAFVINIGDILEIVTNGVYRSIEHRATVNTKKERMSMATFYGPNLDGEMGPAPNLVSPETPALFKRIRVADYVKGFFSRELVGKSYLDVMRIKDDDQTQ